MGPLAVGRLVEAGLHAVGGVQGLALNVSDTGARSWVLRIVVGGKRRAMGLGGFPSVTLADARKAAREARELVRRGIDPIEQKGAQRSALQAAVASAVTFKQCAEFYMGAHEAGWKNVKHAQQWRNTLETYAYPVMGALLVRDVGKEHVMAALLPIWTGKTETAVRLRGRIELVLSYAMQAGYRPEGLNPARWKGGLDKLLPAAGRVSRVKHHPAVPVGQMGAFMTRLRAAEGMGARALEFAILTAARSGEVRGARWSEIDRAAKLWTVPADRMKAGKEHRVPLSEAALVLLDTIDTPAGSDLVFPASRGGMLSDMTLSAVLRRMEVPAVPHGFRSTFRDWVAERTNYPNELAEMALAHAVGDKVEAAYRRGDMLERRAAMMTEWADFVARVERPAQVLPMRAKG
ncbi:MAG: integrase arm-type DNA-binding domain-containing protein [Caldimonas sp.]